MLFRSAASALTKLLVLMVSARLSTISRLISSSSYSFIARVFSIALGRAEQGPSKAGARPEQGRSKAGAKPEQSRSKAGAKHEPKGQCSVIAQGFQDWLSRQAGGSAAKKRLQRAEKRIVA